jgi:endonuclease/exonuclease/phosphatase family metal-dependent hydrolase
VSRRKFLYEILWLNGGAVSSTARSDVTEGILQGQHATQFGEKADQIRVLNWNIERGQRLTRVMDFIGRQQPDICVLQEVDLNAKRTGRLDVANVLASEFGFNYVFGIEFEELSQGSKTDPAFHGQALFARCQILAPRILRFSRQSEAWRPRPFLPEWPVFQPRRGGRMALTAELAFGGTRLVIYNLHLESKGDDNLRLSQLAEAVQDSLRYSPDTPILLAGDLNTGHSPSPLRRYLLSEGFVDASEGCDCGGTKPNGQTLDWIFTRGPAVCSGTRVHQETKASDHYPLSTLLRLTA